MCTRADNISDRNSCCCLGAVALALTAAFIVPGVLGAHKVIHLSQAGQRALFGVGALPGLATAVSCCCATCFHCSPGVENRPPQTTTSASVRRQPPPEQGLPIFAAYQQAAGNPHDTV